MNKFGLVKKISNICRVCEKDVNEIVTTLFDVINKEILNNETVTIINFGKFFYVNRKERIGINPKTREKINIPEKKAIRFIASFKTRADLNK